MTRSYPKYIIAETRKMGVTYANENGFPMQTKIIYLRDQLQGIEFKEGEYVVVGFLNPVVQDMLQTCIR